MIPAAARGISARPMELACEHVHPVSCAHVLRANSLDQLVSVAMEHGAWVHGFTPAFYTEARTNTMMAAVMRHLG